MIMQPEEFRQGRNREQDRLTRELRLQNESSEDRERRLAIRRERDRRSRENETNEDRRLRLDRVRDLRRLRVLNESSENRQIRVEKKCVLTRGHRQNVINEKRERLRQADIENGFLFFDNFDRVTEECNGYYPHDKFVNSHNDNDWAKAKESEMFGYQKMRGYQSLELFWNKKCEYCHAMYLDGETPAFMKKCCGSFKFHGMECEPTGLPDLKPLLPSIKKAIAEEPVHMSKYAQTYNNLLSFGATGVENKRGGGFERGFRGPHAATINGRTYHKTHDQSSSNPSSGLGYIFFDNLQKLNENSEKFEDLRHDILQVIYEDLKSNNSIAQEVSNLGK